jgi:glycosyltransferase involved in cell wall biosynthesis
MKRPAAAPTRLAIVISHPTQYYSPWFRWLAAHTGLRLRVFYLWDFGVTRTLDPRFQTAFKWDVDLLAGYDAQFVRNHSNAPGTESFRGLNNPALTAQLAAWHPAAVLLFGYKYVSHLRAIAWARRARVPLLFRGDSHALGRRSAGGVRGLLLRTLYRQFRAITYVGAANRDYFRALGVPDERLFFAPHAVDHELFAPGRQEHIAAAAALRAELRLPLHTRAVLFAGKFVPAKQPLALLEAFTSLGVENTALILTGDGEQRNALHAAARRARSGSVHVLPFANQSEMPARYLLADVFALPSRGGHETWGLAVNEAMHMGLPCLVSDRVGCQRDLVTDGETGWVFRADEPAHLREQLAAALAADLAPFRAQVARRIAGYTYRASSAGLLAALQSLG